MSAYSPDIHSEDFVTENPRQLLRHQLARVIAINLAGLALFLVFCAIMTVGSPSLLLTLESTPSRIGRVDHDLHCVDPLPGRTGPFAPRSVANLVLDDNMHMLMAPKRR